MSRFITFEGTEGTGKTTQIQLLKEYLEVKKVPTIVTREPGGTELAEQVRDILLHSNDLSISGKAELLLVFAARAQHLNELIRPALERGDWVLCDRFTDATWAYQGGGRGLPSEDIATLERLVHGDLQPDLTLLLDIPVAQGLGQLARQREGVALAPALVDAAQDRGGHLRQTPAPVDAPGQLAGLGVGDR